MKYIVVYYSVNRNLLRVEIEQQQLFIDYMKKV